MYIIVIKINSYKKKSKKKFKIAILVTRNRPEIRPEIKMLKQLDIINSKINLILKLNPNKISKLNTKYVLI